MHQPTFTQIDCTMMHRALDLARRGLGHTNPNPMVGCVITKNDRMIGEGWHTQAGAPHAEIEALNRCAQSTHGATAYITLTPCDHQGRTGPCTLALIQAGITRVVIGATDLNPKTNNSIAYFRHHNIQVDIGCLESACTSLNPIYNHTMQHHALYVHAKWAMSLDGKMQTHANQSRHISNSKSQQHAHYWRQYCDGIVVGVQTILNDNPQLTSRYQDNSQLTLSHPLRIILDPQGKTPLNSHVASNNLPGKTLFLCGLDINQTWKKQIENNGHSIQQVALNKNKYIPLPQLLNYLYAQGLTSILVEGGTRVRNSFINENHIDSCDIYVAPCLIGSNPKKPMQYWQQQSYRLIENDMHLTFTR